MYSEYDKYFGKDTTDDYIFKNEPISNRTKFIGNLRKIGDIKDQYVTNLYYLDTIEYSKDKIGVYSIYNESEPIYSPYYSDSYCRKHKEMVKTNPIVGYRIYPKGVKPEKTYNQRRLYWEQFKM